LWFENTFVPNIGNERPQMLVCDGTTTMSSLNSPGKKKKIDELPSHTSNWTQPFDRTVFKSLKNNWNMQCDNFINNTGVPVGHCQFLRLFEKGWDRALRPSVITNGFKAAGISPFNPLAIPEEAFSPSEMYLKSIKSNQEPGLVKDMNVEPSTVVDHTVMKANV